MPLRDQAAQEASLDNDYGPTRGPNSPDAFEVALFAGDPDIDGVEVPAENVDDEPTGYIRVTLDNDDWLPATGGVKESQPVSWPPAEGEWPETVTHFALRDPVTGAWWDAAPLEEPLDITSASDTGPVLVLAIFYDNNLD